MLDKTVSSYGITRAKPDGDDIDLVVEELTTLGCTTFDSGLSDDELQAIRDGLARVYATQTAEMKKVGVELPSSKDADLVRCPLAYDPVFMKLATNKRLIEVSARIFGDSFVLLQQNGLMSQPVKKHYQTKWHRDLPFQHWTASAPLAVAALLCVDEFNETTGGTYLLPGTHRTEEFPSQTFVLKHQQVTNARPGTFLLMDAMTYHRAGANMSHAPRRAVNHVVGRAFLSQQIDMPAMLGDSYAKDDFLARYFGYRWKPAPSVVAWRTQRNG